LSDITSKFCTVAILEFVNIER